MTLVFLLGFTSIVPGQSRLSGIKPLPSADPAQQGYSTKKTTEDYLETVLSRDTKPLGLKENVVLRNLLRQPAVKWAIRAGIRHGLD
jgi:hypothetical protein